MCNIFIRTKNRPNCSTPKLLNDEGIEHNLVVEPQDYEKYLNGKPPTTTLIVMDKDDGGINYVRRFIMKCIRDSGKPGWMFDDDFLSITNVLPIKRNKMPRTQFKTTWSEAIKSLENDFLEAKIAYGAPTRQAFCCFSEMTGINTRKSEYHMVYMNPEFISQRVYDEDYPWKAEDVCLAARIYLEGGNIASHMDWALGVAPAGVNLVGGAVDLYAKKFEEGNELVRVFFDELLREYFEKLTKEFKKKWGKRKLTYEGVFKTKARYGTREPRVRHSNLSKLGVYLRESKYENYN